MADINIKVGLQGAAEVKAQMGYIQAAADSFANKLTNKFVSTFSAVAVGAMAFDKLFESVNKNIAAAKQITSLSTRFQLDPKQVHSMMIAANNAGVAIRTLLQAMKQITKYADGAMTKSAGNKSMLKQLFGVDLNGKEVTDIEQKIQQIAKSPAKFLPEIAVALAKINNEQDKTKMGTQLLGRQYTQLIPLLDQLAESEEARKNFLENGNAMSAEQVEQAKALGAATSDLQNAWDKFAANLFPVLTFLMSGLTILGSWVKQIQLIGQTWRNEITQKNAESNTKIFAYEQALRNRASSGKLSTEESKDLEEASKGGMSQEEWIQKRIKSYGGNEWDKRRKENANTAANYGAAGIATVGLAAAIAIGTGGVGIPLALAMIAGAGVTGYSMYEGFEEEKSINAEQKAQEEAYAKEIEERKKKFAREATPEEKQKNIERAKLKSAKKMRDAMDKRRAYYKDSGWGDNATNKALETDFVLNQQQEQFDLEYKRDISNAGIMDEPDNTTAIGQAYTFLQQKGASASEQELSDKMLELKLERADAIAGLAKITGRDMYYDRKTLSYKEGKKPKDRMLRKDTKLKFEEEEKKKKLLQDKMNKAKTRAERQQVLAEMRASDTTTPEDEAVAAGKMNIKNTLEDIEENKPKEYETQGIKYDADNTVKIRQSELLEAEKARDAVYSKIDTQSPALNALYKKELQKEQEDAEEAVNVAEGKLKAAEASAATANKNAQEAMMVGIKAKTELANALREHSKATEQLWLKERQRKQQDRKDEEEWERHMYSVKYRNMQRGGYSQSQILQERFLDEVKAYNKAYELQKQLNQEIADKHKEQVEEAESAMKWLGIDPKSEEGKELKRHYGALGTEAEQAQARDAQKEVEAAFQNIEKAFNSWEDNKPERIVSDLGRVGGGFASQMETANSPTGLLKQQLAQLRAITHNTDSLKSLVPNIGNAPQGVRMPPATWGQKERLPIKEVQDALGDINFKGAVGGIGTMIFNHTRGR